MSLSPKAPSDDPSGSPPGPWQRLHAALMPDYNPRATAYWWSVVACGGAGLALAAAGLAGQPLSLQLQVAIGCAIAMLAGLFPVRIPGSRNSFAAGELFIMLLLLLNGPSAAALAAAGEAFVGAARTSKRWTSRIISPATACVSMMLTGSAFQASIGALAQLNPAPGLLDAATLVLCMAAAISHFLLNTALISLVPQLKRNEPLRWRAFIANFGWVGTTYAASALLAGLLHLVFKASGVGVMAAAVPIIIVLLVMLHYHFRQRESDEKANALRIEAAEREAAQSARHLQQLRESERRFHSAFSHAAIGMALVSGDGRMLQANPALAQLLGCQEEDLTGRDFVRHVHAEDRPLLARQWRGLVSSPVGMQHPGPTADVLVADCDVDDSPADEDTLDESAAAVELRCVRSDGSPVTVAVHSGHFADRHASEPCLILQVQDISARREAEAKLQHIAYHDSLTALANRIRFGDCLAQAIARHKRDADYRFAVMYLDFDRFKLINDTLGHSAGDRFLTLVAQRIRDAVRPGDTVGRLGGDEFAILIDGMADEAPTLAMADRLQRMLAEPYWLDGTEVNSSASIGITFSTVGYDTPGDVLRDADIAMYRAKSAGRARTALFDASLRAQLAEQVNLERDLRRAIEQSQLSLSFQPIYDLASGRIDSFEALVRWDHPELGAVPPSTFIPIAEDSAMISPLTDWVLASACQRLREFQLLQGQGARPRLHVNVSGTDMCRAAFVARVSTALLTNGLEPGQLTLEITESTLMKRLDAALEVMAQLREIGVGLSVDDFGTGYSSLSYLSTLPITSLKIDRSFVQRLNADAKDAEVVRAVLTLGHALGKTVIAEGIETPEQLSQLRRMGCQFGQGYLLARPLTPDMAAAVVQADRLRDALGSHPMRSSPLPGAAASLAVH